jgi:hypothetical protein
MAWPSCWCSTWTRRTTASSCPCSPVQREREARWRYLQGAYRDPSAAALLSREPEQLGELRGKVGLFASAAAKQERVAAERPAGALPASLDRIGAAEGRAERTYRTSVDGERAADATGVSRLSAAAEVAIAALRAAPDDKVRAEAWRAVQTNESVSGELQAFRITVAQRYGEDGMRDMLRAASRSQHVAPSAAQQQVAAITVAISAGERAETAQQRETEWLTQRRVL